MNVSPESWLDSRLVVRPSPVHGLGLFARARIRAGEVVMILGGDVLSDVEVRDQIAQGQRYDGIAVDEDANLRIKPSDWPGIHGNHSCDPNLWLTGPVDVSARRDIDPGEEVFTDYATYTTAPEWRMTCSCGSEVCRGTVTGDDWRRHELQEEYAGHFARPVERRISTDRTS